VTRVTLGLNRRSVVLLALVCVLAWGMGHGQSTAGAPPQRRPPEEASAAQAKAPLSPTLALYNQLRQVGLDPGLAFRARELAIDREDLHVYLNDGIIVFTKAVNGRITGALFEGEGEILLNPPDQVERASLGLFTGAGVLTEKFSSAYLRFNDDTYKELRENLQIADDASSVLKDDAAAQKLAEIDGLRLLSSFTSRPDIGQGIPDRYFHARLVGYQFGVFDLVYDSMSEEQISVGKLENRGNVGYYNIWMSFPGQRARATKDGERVIDPWKSFLSVRITDYAIDARLVPPQEIDAEATLRLKVKNGGQRILFFELSRYLKLSEATSGGKALEFIQNESLEGSELARRGNDEVAIIFPEALASGSEIELKLKYRGTVMEQAGKGLLYVGSRGTWYPNRGMAMANFDLRFRWPSEWTLVATGRRVSLDASGNELAGRWVSEIPIPLAGFNLGVYSKKIAKAGTTLVESYATSGMEYSFARQQQTPPPTFGGDRGQSETAEVVPPLSFNPAQTGQSVAERSAKAIEQYSKWFGPYPYSSLALTQFPGGSSQSWPGLIFLSGTVFLAPEERARLKLNPFAALIYSDVMQTHETAHQWWGDLVTWRGYRDQWWVEALANYSALLLLERDHPEQFKEVLTRYREDLLKNSPNGKPYLEAGPVTLGLRLSSSEFPNGYVNISYGRGTWLIHMLRCMLRDGATLSASRLRPAMLRNDDELFFKALRNIREKYAQKELTTAQLIKAFEEQLPESLEFEEKKSLDWFVDGWLKGVAVPEIKMDELKIVKKAGSSPHATFSITQKNAPAELVSSVPVYAVDGEGKETLVARVFADGEQSKFRLAVPSSCKRLVLDPYETVLRRK
jgi:hypothetical protein